MVTARSVPEWVGATPDTPAPARVRVRVFDRCEGRCDTCGRKIAAGETWTLEHRKALINGGQNRESNLGVTCNWCLPEKNATDVAEKSRTYRKRAKHLGIKKSSRPMPGSRGSGWRKHMDGSVSRRDA